MFQNINILDLIFLNLAFLATFTGVIINNFEKYVPAFVIKGYKYGSFAYKGNEANFLQVVEIPKSYYRHFYLFSSVFSVITLLYAYLVYYVGVDMNRYVPMFLKFILEANEPSVSCQAAFIALCLLTVQSLRRLYETYYLQVFAKTSKMNLSHYLAGIVHYFGCVVAVVGQAPLFCGQQNRTQVLWSDIRTSILTIPCVLIFLRSWYEQYMTNVVFANMRKDKKSGKIITENHGIPTGRMFENVSSPHRMCEVIMYTVLVILIPTKTFFCIYLWVLGNQIQTAIQAHHWYKKSFKNYPTNRTAIIPHIL